MFIPRDVLARVYDELTEWRYDDPAIGQGVGAFCENIVNGVYLSEDYGFCALLKQMAEPVICDPTVIVKHYGQSVWTY